VSRTDLPLFSWSPPPCRVLAFPLPSRVGKIRHVALKLSAKATDRHAAYYRDQVEDGIRSQFRKLGIGVEDQDRELAAFWSHVRNEINRIAYHYRDQGGEAS